MATPRILTGPLTRALVVEQPDATLDERLVAGGMTVDRWDVSPDVPSLIERLQADRAQVLFKRSRVAVTREVFAACPDLVAVQLCCIGDDSVDKEAAADHGVLVFNDPVSNGRSVVELVVAYLTGLSRRLFETWADTRQGVWEKSATERYEVQGKTLGVYGLGNIGRSVARACDGLGMRILFWDTREVAEEVGLEMGWERAASPDDLFRRSDAVTVHVSATDHRGEANQGLITRDRLLQLGLERPDASPRIFLNLSRGFLHEPADLLAAVEAGRVRRAAVDVYPKEPRKNGPGWENPYAHEARVVATPHIGAATLEAQPRIARRVAATALGYATRNAVRDCVFGPRTHISMGEHLGGNTVLLVVHATTRGTRKALQDAIFEAGADNLSSQHVDFARWGIAVDVSLLDRQLSAGQLQRIVDHTTDVTGDAAAVRLVRQVGG